MHLNLSARLISLLILYCCCLVTKSCPTLWYCLTLGKLKTHPEPLYFFFFLGSCFLKQFELMFLSVDLDIFYPVVYLFLLDQRNITVLNKNYLLFSSLA